LGAHSIDWNPATAREGRSRRLNRKLAELAKLYGVQTSYKDMRKQRQEASVESVLLVLRALGAPVERMGDVSAALRKRNDELKERLLEPVTLAWDGQLKVSDVHLPANSKPTLILENGETMAWPPQPLPTGYHKLIVKSGNHVHESFVISAPVRAHF